MQKTFFQGSEYFFLFGQKQLLQNMQSHKNALKYTILHNNIFSAYKEHLLESDREKNIYFTNKHIYLVVITDTCLIIKMYFFFSSESTPFNIVA